MTAEQWLEEYGRSHQNPINKRIHWICVPAISVSLVALLSLVPLPWLGGYLNGAHLFLIGALIFYFRLSVSLGWGMVVFAIFTLLAVWKMSSLPFELELSSITLFVVAWIGQFIGHAIEGRRPSFFRDLQFLLIGPLWLVADLREKWRVV